jgi:uncharacterized membrane protein YfcA
MIMDLVLFTASFLAGAIAAISGFGIGSILTPVISASTDTKLAVAIVSIPHFVGTLIRFIRLRRYIDRSLAFNFGIASAVGGVTGALLNAYANGPILGYTLGSLLIFAGLSGVTGLADRIQLKGRWKWVGGFASASFGGLVGNQGGIRSAAMLGFNLPKEAFVATATAIALVVDAVRMPIYFATEHELIITHWPTAAIATAGVIVGTFVGSRLLERIPDRVFKRVVSVLIFSLGMFMLFRKMGS